MLARFETPWLLGDNRDVVIKIGYHPPGTPSGTKLAPIITVAKWNLEYILEGKTEADGICDIEMSVEDKYTYLSARICPKIGGDYKLQYSFEVGETTRVAEVILHVR